MNAGHSSPVKETHKVNNIPDIVKNLCSTNKLNRDTSLVNLQRVLPLLDKSSQLQLESSIIKILNDSEADWECHLGCLLGVKIILQLSNWEFRDKEYEFSQQVLGITLKKLNCHEDCQVIRAAGEIIGVLCKKLGPSIYLNCRKLVTELIHHSLKLQDEVKLKQLQGASERRISAENNNSGLSEASLHVFQVIVESCDTKFVTYVNNELLDLIVMVLEHRNKSVRESAFYLAAAIASCSAESGSVETCEKSSIIFVVGQTFLNRFADGLADECSSVRLAASIAVRRFLLALPSDEARKTFYPVLLPRMCLNRYYAVEGVHIFSQETWRQVAGCKGKELVQEYLDSAVEFYIYSINSPNHAVREAACSCIDELATKLEPDKVKSHVHKLLHKLKECFIDDSWLVRNAACLACGSFVLHFPKESASVLTVLYPHLFRILEDAVPSVRIGAATTLANIVRVHGETALPVLVNQLRQGLEGLSNQPSDISSEINNQSVCSSVMPRLGRSSSTDHTCHRSSQPWELADGCVLLMTELAIIPSAALVLPPLLPLLAEASTMRHYEAHLIFLQTVCKHLITIAKGVGKKNFKLHLDEFLEPIFYALDSENSHTSSAASQCLNQMSTYFGSNVLRARVQSNNPSHLQHLDANLFIAPF